MKTLADRSISVLRDEHDELVGVVGSLSADQLAGRSGASEWSVAQVLSHLGSGAEIAFAALQAATTGTDPRDDGFNQQVWDRWNALAPAEQARASVESNGRLVEALESLSAEQRDELRFDLGFLPEPVPLSMLVGLRLNEVVNHAWDVRVAIDPTAGLSTTAAGLLAEHLSGDLGFMVGFIGKPDALATPVVVEIEGAGYAIEVADGVRFVAGPGPGGASAGTAVFRGPLEAAVRLVVGRLPAERTPAGTSVTGDAALDELRRVFPGF